MSLSNCLNGRTDPLLKMQVHLSQYIKITKTSQKLGAFQMIITPNSDAVCTLSFQNPGSAPVLSLPLKSNFNYVLHGKFEWQITDTRNKQWIVSFIDEKDMSRAMCVMALVLNYKDDSVLKYDLPGQEHNGKEVGLGDRVQITYYVYTFSDFPYIDKLYLTKENSKSKLSSQHLAKGFVQGMTGMTCNSSRAIYVPASLAASDSKDQGHPIDDVLYYVTLKHAKYSSEQSGESEHTEVETETEDPSETPQSETETETKKTEQSHVFISPPSTVSIPSLSPQPSSGSVSSQQNDSEPDVNEKSDILAKIRKIGGIMPGGMMGMPMQYGEKRRLSYSKNDDSEKKISIISSQNEEKRDEMREKKRSERRKTTANLDSEEIDPNFREQLQQRKFSKTKEYSDTINEPEDEPEPEPEPEPQMKSPPRTQPQSFQQQQQPVQKSQAAKRGLFDEPRNSVNSEILQRMEDFERMIDKKLSLVCGSYTDLVDPDTVIRGVSSMAIQLKMKASEAETIRKQLTQMKIKNSGAAASTRQLEAAKAEVQEAKALKANLEAKVKQAEMKVKELERIQLEASDNARKTGNSYVKAMMSKVFDNMNSTFNERGIYSGKDVSDALYKLLRTEAFATMEQINENGLI